ncbi:MAG: hypothetical protein P8R54_02345 [Myxococcota bacterium]|nr:hypothetical protein [Myxococcota bacterium]
MLTRPLTVCLPAGNDPLQVRSGPVLHLVLAQAASDRPAHADPSTWSPCRPRVGVHKAHRFLHLSPGESAAGMPICEDLSQSSAGPEPRLKARCASGPHGSELSYDGVDP